MLRKSLFLIALLASSSISAQNITGKTASYRFISKMYTEALGRLPDQSGYQGFATFADNNTCLPSTMSTMAIGVLDSQEFNSLFTNNNERVFKLYRAVFHRDASSQEFDSALSKLSTGTTWTSLVSGILSSPDFSNYVSTMCVSTHGGGQKSTPYNKLSTSGSGFRGGSGDDLQRLLNNTSVGGIVYLEQGAIVKLTSPLVIPKGVTLTTTGTPGKKHTGLLGRLVRAGSFNDSMVIMSDSSKLISIWVDGQRDNLGFIQAGINVHGRGNAIEVRDNFISDSTGWSTVQFWGDVTGFPCGSGWIVGNLVTAYGSKHSDGQWTDGISVSCENALVEDNSVVDATDVGIVLFYAKNAQKSIVRNNTVVNIGTSAFGGIVADPLQDGKGTKTHNFTGAQFTNNLLWTSGAAHMDIAISVGTRPWFGVNSDKGDGIQFLDNTTGTLSVNAYVGIAIQGMTNVKVQRNNLIRKNPNVAGKCPIVNVAAAISTGYASGDIQGYTNTDIGHCIGH